MPADGVIRKAAPAPGVSANYVVNARVTRVFPLFRRQRAQRLIRAAGRVSPAAFTVRAQGTGMRQGTWA